MSSRRPSAPEGPGTSPARADSTLRRVLEPELMDTDEEARDYDEMDHAEVNARFVTDLLARRPDTSRVLDVGTGTALVPIELCRREPRARVVAIDLADHMLAYAARNVERAAVAGVVRVEKGDAKRLSFRDHAFACVMSNSIVHHVPDPSAALVEMARVLAPDGWLFVRDLARPRDDAEVARLVETYAAGANERQRALLEASLRAALTPDEVRAIAAPLGIDPSSIAMTSDRHWTLAWRKA